MLSLVDGRKKASVVVVGTPGLPAVRRALLQAMTAPHDAQPGRPPYLDVANRYMPQHEAHFVK